MPPMVLTLVASSCEVESSAKKHRWPRCWDRICCVERGFVICCHGRIVGGFMIQRAVLVLLFLGSLALIVSAGQSQHRGVDYISADANLVRIQVIVFDNKGAIATDLTKQDFRVL